MGKKARNAGNKKSKTCDKLATTKSVKARYGKTSQVTKKVAPSSHLHLARHLGIDAHSVISGILPSTNIISNTILVNGDCLAMTATNLIIPYEQ